MRLKYLVLLLTILNIQGFDALAASVGREPIADGTTLVVPKKFILKQLEEKYQSYPSGPMVGGVYQPVKSKTPFLEKEANGDFSMEVVFERRPYKMEVAINQYFRTPTGEGGYPHQYRGPWPTAREVFDVLPDEITGVYDQGKRGYGMDGFYYSQSLDLNPLRLSGATVEGPYLRCYIKFKPL